MITESEIGELRLKILPAGGEQVIEMLHRHRERVTTTSVTLENVPLIILARHGMIGRLPVEGSLQKLSQAAAIVEALRRFFESGETLYLYVNLPDLAIPSFVDEVISEVAARMAERERLRGEVDRALEVGDRALFQKLSAEWRRLDVRDRE